MKLKKTFSLITVVLYYLLTVVECLIGYHHSAPQDVIPLPFTCPYEIPKEFKEGLDPGLLGSAGTDLSKVSIQFNAEYRAATALVPCDATVMRVFTEEDIQKEYTVSVIFVYESSVDRIKKWLKYKYHAESYENPIRDAVIKQCPHEVHHHSKPYLRSLTGDEIMNILCQKNCTLEKHGYHAIKKRSHLHHAPALLPVVHPYHTSYNSIPAYPHHPVPHHPVPHHPIPHHPVPHHPIPHHPVPHHPVEPYHTPEYHHHPVEAYHPLEYPVHHPVDHAPSYHPLEYPHLPVAIIRFDDAPDPIYGHAIRTRRFDTCDGRFQEQCNELEGEGKVVECQQARFSECDSEWTDCISENEKYLRGNRGNETSFYKSCKIITGFGGNTELREVSSDTCFENRKCESNSKEDAVGVDENCKCNVKEPVDDQDVNPEDFQKIYKRQTGEVYATSATDKRVMRTTNGNKRIARDKAQVTRKAGSYSDINQIHIDRTNAVDEDEEDFLG